MKEYDRKNWTSLHASMPAFFRWSFLAEIVFTVYFKVKVSAVKVGVRRVKFIFLIYLMVINLNYLFVLPSHIFKPCINLIKRKI